MPDRFFSKINYSACNEDSVAELKALNLKEQDRVVCITGSGARPLDLLTAVGCQVFSVDFNAAQNHLLHLKLAAHATLDYWEYLEFLGVTGSTRRLKFYAALVEKLPVQSQEFWDRRHRVIEAGVIYGGTWEKLLRWMSKGTWFRRKHLRGLFEAPNLDSQRGYWNRHWANSWLLRQFLRVGSTRFLWTNVIREPGARLIPSNFDVAGYMLQCLQRMAEHSMLRENPFANLVFLGRYGESCRLPLHLREEHFDVIRRRVNQVEVVTGTLDRFLQKNPDRFDAYSLSDISSYAPPEVHRSIWSGVVTSARESARFCERFFMVKPDVLVGSHSLTGTKSVVRDEQLEDTLRTIDSTCLYTFHAGSIGGPGRSKGATAESKP